MTVIFVSFESSILRVGSHKQEHQLGIGYFFSNLLNWGEFNWSWIELLIHPHYDTVTCTRSFKFFVLFSMILWKDYRWESIHFKLFGYVFIIVAINFSKGISFFFQLFSCLLNFWLKTLTMATLRCEKEEHWNLILIKELFVVFIE